MQGDKTVYQKYKDIRQSRLCSARLEAGSGQRTERMPTKNQRDENQGLVSSEEIMTSPLI